MDKMFLYGVIAVLLIIPVKFLVPKMMESNDARLRFTIGLVLFGIYTAVVLLVCAYLNQCIPGFEETGRFRIYAAGILLTDLIAVFTALQYFLTRDKRRMTESDKMKLKDL